MAELLTYAAKISNSFLRMTNRCNTECSKSHCAVATTTVVMQHCQDLEKKRWCSTTSNTNNVQIMSKTWPVHGAQLLPVL